MPNTPGTRRPFLALTLALLGALLAAAPARSSGPVATDGVWDEQHPLSAATHGAIVDPVFDRMVVLREQPEARGLGRMSVWSLPLHGAPVWHRDDVTVPAELNTANSFRNAVYDPKRHRVLIVVLTDDLTRMSVWALPLHAPYAWQEIATAGTPPSPRFEPGLVLDAARDRLVLFGGRDMGVLDFLNDTWSLSLAGTPTWTPIAPAGPLPPGTVQPSLALDAAGDRMVAFCSAGAFSSDRQTWALSLGASPAWMRLDADADPLAPAYGSTSLAIDPAGARVLAFDSNDRRVSALPLAGGAWTTLGYGDWPFGLGASVVRDAARGRFLVHGGGSGGAVKLADTFAYSPASGWSTLVSHFPEPLPRSSAAAAVDFTRGRLIVHGGLSDQYAVFGDTWALSFADLTWTQLTPVGGDIPFRAEEQAAYDPIQDRLLVVGGTAYFPSPDSLDVWQLSFASEPPVWTKLHPLGTPPSARIGGAVAFDLARNRLVMYGGVEVGTGTTLDEAWALELGGTPTWHPIAPAAGVRPGPLAGAMMAADPPRARVVMFGGADASSSYHDETWVLTNDGVSDRWLRLAADLTAPGGRDQSAMVYDAILDRMLVHGGYGVQMESGFPHLLELNDTWELSLAGPGSWRRLDSGGDIPLTRERHVMGFDGQHDRLVVTTGLNAAARGVWALSFSPPVEDVPPAPAPAAPTSLALAPLRNPCAGALDVRLALPARGRVTLEVLDVSGRRVVSRDLGELDAGSRVVRVMEPGAVAPGLYVVRAHQDSRATTAKVLMVR